MTVKRKVKQTAVNISKTSGKGKSTSNLSSSLGSAANNKGFRTKTTGNGNGTSQNKEKLQGLVEEIRIWRDDSFSQRLYQSALFWADKIVAMTG
jgi:hypothetical protein